ncbi:MAG: protein kinase [Bacteroidales bacterium]|nr:protein kinase [Bacteroidales bacterium]
MSGEASNLIAGATLQGGKYKIIKVLGQGGFGITYLAEQTGLEMKVAIKEFFLKGSCQRDAATSEVRIPVADNKDLVDRCLRKFRSEAKKIASLNNDHIVNIIDVFDENGTSYYVMKYLGRGALSEKLQKGPLKEEDALRVIREVADALDSVHSNGLLHLDVKPANILFDERGRAVLIDFGVSKYVDSDQDTATTSSLVGFSRGFAPLEQINATGTSLSPASDIYALGATLYNLVVGITPPDASSVMDNGLPTFPPHIGAEVKEAIVKSMQPRRKDRPQNISEFIELLPDELEVIQVEEPTEIRGNLDATVPKKGNPRWHLFVSAAMLVASFVLVIIAHSKMHSTSDNSQSDAKIEELNQNISSLSDEKDELQKQINELNNKVNALNASNKSLNKELDDKKRTIEDKDKTINNLNTDLRKANKDVENLKTTLKNIVSDKK